MAPDFDLVVWDLVGNYDPGQTMYYFTTSQLGINNDYYWSAHSSRLVAFSQTGPLSDPDALKFNRMNFIATVGLMATTGKDSGSTIIQKTGLLLTGISEDEYVYGTSFGNGYKFGFNDEGISIGFTRVTFSPGD